MLCCLTSRRIFFPEKQQLTRGPVSQRPAPHCASFRPPCPTDTVLMLVGATGRGCPCAVCTLSLQRSARDSTLTELEMSLPRSRDVEALLSTFPRCFQGCFCGTEDDYVLKWFCITIPSSQTTVPSCPPAVPSRTHPFSLLQTGT